MFSLRSFVLVVALCSLELQLSSASPHGEPDSAKSKHSGTKGHHSTTSGSKHHTTKTATDGTSTTNGTPTPTGTPSSGELSSLFPVQPILSSWTTSQSSKDPLPLSDDTLQPFKEITALTHTYMNAPDGVYSMQAHYPKGSYNFGGTPRGGFSFYAPGPNSLDMTTAKEITYGYTVLFPEGFDFVKGGKIPGLYGGDTPDGSVSCSGGRKVDNCFSIRHMWRTNGLGEIYAYVPPYTDAGFEANKALCSVKPLSECNPQYGNSVGRGAFSFTPGKRNTIAQRVKLNDVGQANGELELFFEGKSVINVGGIIIRDTDAGRVRGIQFQTFFG